MINYRNSSHIIERADGGRHRGFSTQHDYTSDSEDSYTEEELLTYAQKSNYFNQSDVLERAVLGEPAAFYAIAQRYGRSHKATKWYLRAAEGGQVDAQVKMAEYYLNSATKKDPKQALHWYLQAESNGKKDVLFNIASIYRTLTDVDGYSQIAMQWYLKAYEEDDLEAAFEIGTMYEKGEGVDQDYAEAMKWYMKADKGEEKANVAMNVANLYKNGYGIKKDLDEAERWYKRAYLRGDKSAAAEVSKFYDPAGFAWWYRSTFSNRNSYEELVRLERMGNIHDRKNKESIEEEISQSKMERFIELTNKGYHITPTETDVEKMKSDYENEIQCLIDRIKELEECQERQESV